jgi:hypothetical protein
MFKTVEDFKASISGLAVSNRYHVTFSRTQFLSIFPKNEYSYLVSSINIPGQEIKINSATFWGMKKDIASTVDFDPISMVFLCDSEMKVRRAFEMWLDEIVNKSTFTAGYYKDYTCFITIQVLNRALVPIREYKIREAYPTNITDIPLGYEKNDEAMQFTVTFKYWDFETRNLIIGG